MLALILVPRRPRSISVAPPCTRSHAHAHARAHARAHLTRRFVNETCASTKLKMCGVTCHEVHPSPPLSRARKCSHTGSYTGNSRRRRAACDARRSRRMSVRQSGVRPSAHGSAPRRSSTQKWCRPPLPTARAHTHQAPQLPPLTTATARHTRRTHARTHVVSTRAHASTHAHTRALVHARMHARALVVLSEYRLRPQGVSTGCGFDYRRLWTRTPCAENGTSGYVTMPGAPRYITEPSPTDHRGVRCPVRPLRPGPNALPSPAAFCASCKVHLRHACCA